MQEAYLMFRKPCRKLSFIRLPDIYGHPFLLDFVESLAEDTVAKRL